MPPPEPASIPRTTGRLFIVEDETIVRTLLVETLDAVAGIEVVGESADGDGLTEALVTTGAECLLVDLMLPGRDGVEIASEAMRRLPRLKVIVLTTREDERSILRVLKSGLHGFVNKRESFPELLAAVRKVLDGGLGLNKRARMLLQQMDTAGDRLRGRGLTSREEEIVRLIAHGMDNQSIAGQLNLSPHTIKTHRRNILAKLDLHDRVDLVRWAIDNNLL